MSSQESLSSNPSYDAFLMERMAPVIIAGGEVIENRNTSSELTRTESNQSSAFRRPSVESHSFVVISRSASEVLVAVTFTPQRDTAAFAAQPPAIREQ
ncbi:c060524f-84e8-4725-926a-33fe39c64878 [Thermothielavioides terrestris]|uniref:C060524f-84e8-4725-926a-33fe39c64878 n=1 Tax=Thermothielavioides terrestris TaxID=2587410 RepID=A0A446BFS5_9PEZI|nr:c060524f-84e8-4725-926a-33fe39c64878 [Thermothielavioides terrestris]